MSTIENTPAAGEKKPQSFRSQWEQEVRSAGIGKGARGATTLAVAFALGTYANPDGSSVRPSMETVAKGCGFSTRTVERAVDRLRDEGWLTLVRAHAPHRPALFQLAIPEHPTKRSGIEEKASEATPDHTVGDTRPYGREHPTTRSETPDHTVPLPVQGPVQGPEQLPVQRGTDVPPPTQSVWDDPWAELDEEPPAAANSGEEKGAPPVPFSGEREESQPVRYFDEYEAPPVPQDEELGHFAAKELRRRERLEQEQPERYVSAYVRSWRDA